MTRPRPRRLPLAVLLAVAALFTGWMKPASAQMPDLRAIVGKPLPVGDLPGGTVVVRLGRQGPQNPIAGAEISAVVAAPGGDSRKRTAKTGPDGRATFEGVPAGAGFQASVTVDGEQLQSERFTVPDKGGVRVMLIAGLGTAPSGGAPAAEGGGPGAGAPAGRETFHMGASTGTVGPADDLPKGTLEIILRDEAGNPIIETPVRLGEIRLRETDETKKFLVRDATSDGAGVVRFTDLTTGEGSGYAAVIDHQGMRLSTEPFRMPAEMGMRGQIAALRRSSDRSALKLRQGSRLIFYVSEESLAFMLAAGVSNTSKGIFEPGPEGLFFKAPEGAVGIQEIPGGAQVEVVGGSGVKLNASIPPDSPGASPVEVRFGYALHTDGASTLKLRQPVPLAMPEPTIIVPIKNNLTLEAPGLRELGEDVSSTGEKVKVYTLPDIPAGGTLALTISGFPARDRSGAFIAGGLCAALVLAGVLWARPPRGRVARGKAGPDRDGLVERRETLFAELCEVERQRRQPDAAPGRQAGVEALDNKRRDLVGRLESVYKDLAELP